MNSNPLDDAVSRQYDRWLYPAPIADLPTWTRENWQWFDPSHAHRLLWPDRDYPEGLDILIAGCGTNQAAVFAFTNPTARVVAVDVSESALAHHRVLAERHGLGNLELHRMPVERIADLGRDFDLIVSTGVLHHLVDPAQGMRALAECLRVDGVLAVMLYATYGRVGVQMLQSVFRDLELGQDGQSVALVRDALVGIDPMHPVHAYLGIAPDLSDDGGIVDTFLHGRERTYTIDECRELVAESGLAFQDLFFHAPYSPLAFAGNPFLDAVARLPQERQWSIMERYNPRNACHFFLACRPERPRSAYAIDLSSDAWAKGTCAAYVPSFRHACRLDGSVVHRQDWQLELDSLPQNLLAEVDGRASIATIVARVAERTGAAAEDVSGIAAEVFRLLWQLDILAMGFDRRS